MFHPKAPLSPLSPLWDVATKRGEVRVYPLSTHPAIHPSILLWLPIRVGSFSHQTFRRSGVRRNLNANLNTIPRRDVTLTCTASTPTLVPAPQ